MKKILLVLITFLLVSPVVSAANLELKKKVGDYDVIALLDKNPPVIGKNNLSIEIKDKSGKAVSDAKVTVEYGMPAMPGMPPHNAKKNTEFKNGKYFALIEFSMRGAWNIDLKIDRGSKISTAKFTVDVQ